MKWTSWSAGKFETLTTPVMAADGIDVGGTNAIDAGYLLWRGSKGLVTDHELWQYASRNRADIDNHERELNRMRERQHEMAGEIAAFRYMGQQVGELAKQVGNVSGKLDTLSRRAIEKPRVPTVSVFVQLAALVVAIVAIVVAVTR